MCGNGEGERERAVKGEERKEERKGVGSQFY
jgi:hypothetical protein